MSSQQIETQPTSCVILNASAGADDKKELSAQVRQVFEQKGRPCAVVVLNAGANIVDVAAEAVRNGVERVVAAGGDGTLRAVTAALAGTGVPLGILPAGTLNHLARDLEIPFEPTEALEIAAGTGVPVQIDIGEVNGHVFINNAVLGLYPFYRGHRDARQAAGLGVWTSFFDALSRTIRRYPRMTVRVRSSRGLDLVRSTPYLMIANNEHAMEGFKPWQRDAITEGELYIYILRDRSRWAMLRVLGKIAAGGRLVEEEFECIRAPEVTIETRARQMRVSLDGEMLTLDVPLQFRSRRGALAVLVPPDSKRAHEAPGDS